MRRVIGILISLTVATIMSACGGGDINSTPPAQLRVFHASPDAPNVDVYVDGAKVLANVPYSTLSPYLSLPAGKHHIQVNAAGTATTVIDVSLTLGSSDAYTAIAAGFLANIEALLAADDTSPAASGQARLRVIHASPDAGPVDILVNGQVVLSNVAFGTISNYLTVPAGTYTVQVNAAGTSTTAITASVTLTSQSNYSAAAIGSLKTAGTHPLALKLLTDG
ncbi:DUF4397 domain-containing protein (plasmid) [Paraburkholderia sp. PREW-6R]|uniref:DUF4397 domain-containing protein n=1 Tax=Paraburkholderia sp. PREW-6R TaxID=3141544 RepID=UPI0031F4A23F